MGRSLLNTVYNLGLKDQFADSLNQLGYDLEQLVEEERDAALGNGGLGRLAACFLDSIATLSLPGWGYGIRYRYGMFKQVIDKDGYQQAVPDVWLTTGNPWDIPRYNVQFPVSFYGEVKDGKWVPGEQVMALAYDTPIPGFQTNNTMNLRLWEAKPMNEFDLDAFNTGAYVDAIMEKQRAEAISAVLYPNDNTAEGKELRLKQQFFFVSASLQDIIARFKEDHKDLKDLPDKAAVQMNDTHPTIGVPELMRLLMDQEGLDWDAAWDITYRTMNFTNHTVMPEVGKLLSLRSPAAGGTHTCMPPSPVYGILRGCNAVGCGHGLMCCLYCCRRLSAGLSRSWRSCCPATWRSLRGLMRIGAARWRSASCT